MESIFSIGKIKALFFLPTICKIGIKGGGHAIVLAWIHGYVGFKIDSYD